MGKFISMLVLLLVSLCAQGQTPQSQQLFKQGIESLRDARFDAAASAFQQSLRSDPDNAQTHYYLGEAYLGLKDVDRARKSYQKSLVLDPVSTVAADVKNRLAMLEASPAATPLPARAIAPVVVGTEIRECKDCPPMVIVPAGTFTIGSPASEPGSLEAEGHTHVVRFERPFAVGKYEVTFQEWDACVAARACAAVSDGGLGRGQRPVINVTFEQVHAYTAWLAKVSGKPYRLLSEAEWEYAARGGKMTARPWGNGAEQACQYANVYDVSGRAETKIERESFDCTDGFGKTAPVGRFKPNDWGLYDMLGNVWEFVADCYNRSYEDATDDGRARTSGDCGRRLMRGGSWIDSPSLVRSARRSTVMASEKGDNIGFRVARSLP